MTVIHRLLLTLLAVSLPVAVSAQSLGDAAARERAKREEKARQGKAAGKVYTNSDLAEPGKTAESGGSATDGGAQGQPDAPSRQSLGALRERGELPQPSAAQGENGEERASSAPSEGPESSAENASEEASWRQRAASARAPLTQAEGQLAQVDGRIASIREQLSPLRMGGPEQDTNKILALQDELTQVETERASAQNAVEEARKQWQSFLDEAKGGGVPAGWLEGSPR